MVKSNDNYIKGPQEPITPGVRLKRTLNRGFSWNPGYWALESGLLNDTIQVIWIPLTTGIQNATSDNPLLEIGNPWRRIQNSRLPWIQLMGRKALFRQYLREMNLGTLTTVRFMQGVCLHSVRLIQVSRCKEKKQAI